MNGWIIFQIKRLNFCTFIVCTEFDEKQRYRTLKVYRFHFKFTLACFNFIMALWVSKVSTGWTLENFRWSRSSGYSSLHEYCIFRYQTQK